MTKKIKIGLEIHVEPKTLTKLFCSCERHPKNSDTDLPNKRTCPICLGHPGARPLPNKQAIIYALKVCHALNCTIALQLIFSRKSYFYPDLAKNYQISQHDEALGTNGSLKLSDEKTVNITRAHLEEDPASLIHPPGGTHSLIDYNRSGSPLIEIVTAPDLSSPEEAREFMKKLMILLEYLEVFDPEICLIKADTNISIQETGFTRVEVKNVSGFKEIERAILYEVARQKQLHKEGTSFTQETRAWNAELGKTTFLRKKEREDDYGYILDDDLTPIDITQDLIKQATENLPELPDQKRERYTKEFKISEEDAVVLTQEKPLALFFESVAKKISPPLAAKWIRRELARVLNYTKKSLAQSKILPDHVITLLSFIENKKITDNTAKKILEKLSEKPFDVEEYIKKENLESVSDSSQLKSFCEEAIKEQPAAADDYKSGNEKALHFLVGQVMKKSKGQAQPDVVRSLFVELLK